MFKETIKEVRVINGQIKRSFLRINIIPLLQGWATRKFKDPKHLNLYSHNFKLVMQHWKRVFYYKQNLTRTVRRLAIPANSKTKATLTRSRSFIHMEKLLIWAWMFSWTCFCWSVREALQTISLNSSTFASSASLPKQLMRKKIEIKGKPMK